MFQSLSEKLANAFKKFKSKGKLTEADVREGMREVKLALLEADVNFKVVKDFVKAVTERAVGAEVLESLLPAQQIIKIVNEELINLMGAVGGILYLALAAVLYPASRKVAGHVDYQPLFIIVSLIMAVSVLVLALTVKEKRLSEENRALEKQHPDWNLAAKDESGNEVLPKEVKRSLTFLLASISLWFIAYNGVTTWFTKYIEQVMGEGLGGASTCLLVATAGAICSYIPIGALAAKIGRKRTIQLGVALLTLCFLLGFVLTCTSSVITPVMYVVFALVGLAWAAINVNSLPMVVEMCRGSDIGRFTGYYYTFSMVAQVVTPIAAGSLMRAIDYRVLFPYAAIFSTLSFVTMCFVRHGDAKAEVKKGLEAFEDMDVE